MQACVPWLIKSLDDMPRADEAFIVAGATPAASLIVATDNWPLLEPGVSTDRAANALALYRAIEDPAQYSNVVIFWSLAILLGKPGIAALNSDFRAVVANGDKPLIVALASQTGDLVSVVVTVTALPTRPTLH